MAHRHFKQHFVHGKPSISIKNAQKFVSKGQIDNKEGLIKIIVLGRKENKLLSD